MNQDRDAAGQTAPAAAGPDAIVGSRRFAGRFVLLRTLGRGGMGEVFLARDIATMAECALKRLDGYTGAGLSDLANEFEALSRVHHPAVVRVYEFGVAPDGTPYYTMEYAPGEPADRAVARGDWTAIAHVGAEIAHALEVLHAASVAHGDIKPANVLVRPVAQPGVPADVKLLDLGLAALLKGDKARGRGHTGTAGFAAPERSRGAAPDVSSDLYGLGATLYQMAAGRPPFEGDNVEAVLRAQRAGAPNSLALEEAGSPPRLRSLILRLLAPEPADRPRSAREVRQELEQTFPQVRRPLVERLQSAAFVGREPEFGRIARAAAARSGPRLVFVAGEPGIGKTAWLGEVATRATLDLRPVVRLSCAAFEGPRAVAEALARRFAAEAGMIVETLPEGEALADAAAGWLGEIERRGRAPYVLLDDAERLDAASARFVRRIALHPSKGRWLIVLSSRAEGATAFDPGRLLRDGGSMEWIELAALAEEDATALIAARLRAPAPETLAQALWARAQGHPGLTVELLLLAARNGVLREDESGLIVEAAALGVLDTAGDFMAAVAARLDALPDAAHAAAEVLAVWGEPVEGEALTAIEPVIDTAAITTLVESRLCARDRVGRLAWGSPSLAEQVLRRLDPARRRTLHEAILAQPGLSPTARFRHLAEAGRVAEALAAAEEGFALHADVSLAEQAARFAGRHGLTAEAAAWWDRAARIYFEDGRYPAAVDAFEAAMTAGLAGEARAASLHLMALSLSRVGRSEEAAQCLQEGLTLNPSSGIAVRLVATQAMELNIKGDMSPALARAREAVILAKGAGDPEATGLANQVLGVVLTLTGQADEAESYLRTAKEAYAEVKQGLGTVRAQLGLAMVARSRADHDGARRLTAEALEKARTLGSRIGEMEVLTHSATLLVPMGLWEQARSVLEETLRIALEDERPPGVATSITSLATLEALMGLSRQSRRHSRLAVRLVVHAFPRFASAAWRSRALSERSVGRARLADVAARRALRAARESRQAADMRWAAIEFGRVMGLKGRWVDARHTWQRTADAGPSGDPIGDAIIEALIGRANLLAGDVESAHMRLERARTPIADRALPYAEAHVGALSAGIAIVEGRTAAGGEEARKAFETLSALPAPLDRAEVSIELSALAIRYGAVDVLPVGDWLDQAAATFERIGNRHGRTRALALQVEWFKRRGSATVSSVPATVDERGLLQAVRPLVDSILDLPELLHRAMRLAVEQLGAERGVLLLADPETGKLTPMADFGGVDVDSRRDAVGYSSRVVEHVATTGGAMLIGDAPGRPGTMSQSMVDLRLRSILCVPMFLGGKVVGAVYLDDSRRSDAFTAAERSLLEGFAYLMGVAIERARGHEQVRRTSEDLLSENLVLRQEVAVRYRTDRMIGSSEAMRRVLSTVERAAAIDASVLITGENGTGKELLARILHSASKRKSGPFVTVNCGAIPDDLLESELFGINPGVATGVAGRDGRFKQAEGGTLFLDEIGEMPLSHQVALLSVLSSGWVTPVGGERSFQSNVRVITASNGDLRRMIADSTFREDLWYRLNVIGIEVPPLRERKADIPSLAHHFVAHFAEKQERSIPEMSSEFMTALMRSDWPGNIRELQNYIEKMVAMTPGEVLNPNPPPRDLESSFSVPQIQSGRLTQTVGEIERKLVEDALVRAGGNQSHAARELGIKEQTIRYRIKKYRIEIPRKKQRSR